MSYLGQLPINDKTTRFTVTSVLTALDSLTDFAISYEPGYLDVFKNGVKLYNGTDYSAANGSTVILTSPAAIGDKMELISYSVLFIAGGGASGVSNFDGGVY
jgi:hypothetical protein